MLPKSLRLNLRLNYRRVSSGYKLDTPNLRINYRYTTANKTLVAISVPKKIFIKAHERNFVRRLISGALEQVYSNLKPGLDIIFFPKQSIINHTSQELTEEVKNEKSIYQPN